jgi:hypothetical protein
MWQAGMFPAVNPGSAPPWNREAPRRRVGSEDRQLEISDLRLEISMTALLWLKILGQSSRWVS